MIATVIASIILKLHQRFPTTRSRRFFADGQDPTENYPPVGAWKRFEERGTALALTIVLPGSFVGVGRFVCVSVVALKCADFGVAERGVGVKRELQRAQGPG